MSKSCACEIDIRKSHVQLRLQLIRRHLRDLIGNELPLAGRLLGHPQQGLRSQDAEISLIDLQEHVRARGHHVFFLGSGVQRGAFHKLVCAPEIGNQLADRETVRVFIENSRVVQRSRADSVRIHRFRAGQAAINVGIIRSADFPSLRICGRGQRRCGLNLRMILDGNLFRLLQAESLGGLRGLSRRRR